MREINYASLFTKRSLHPTVAHTSPKIIQVVYNSNYILVRYNWHELAFLIYNWKFHLSIQFQKFLLYSHCLIIEKSVWKNNSVVCHLRWSRCTYRVQLLRAGWLLLCVLLPVGNDTHTHTHRRRINFVIFVLNWSCARLSMQF